VEDHVKAKVYLADVLIKAVDTQVIRNQKVREFQDGG
jgi:hypothetical protein